MVVLFFGPATDGARLSRARRQEEGVDLISPPTDNLYKFMAIAGLTLMVLSGVGPLRILHDVKAQVSQLSVERAVLSEELRALRQKDDRSVNTLSSDELEAWAKGTKLSIPFRKRLEQLEHPGLVRDMARLDEKTDLANSDESFQTWAAYTGLLGGLVLAILGFLLWYCKVQRYLDDQLKRTARGEAGDQTSAPSSPAPPARSGT